MKKPILSLASGVFLVVFSTFMTHGSDAADAAKTDLQDADVQKMKSKLDCSRPPLDRYCRALDQFSSGQAPQVADLSFFAGSSLFVNQTGSTPEIKEEASYLILDSSRAQYDSIISESDDERKQVETYLSYFRKSALPPDSDPVVGFSKQLKITEAVPLQKMGRSHIYARPLKSYDTPNLVYLRETPEAIVAVEVAGPVAESKSLFFVGTFNKKLKFPGK